MSQGEDRIQSPLTAVRILCATANATPGRPSALAFPSSSPSSMLRVRACMASVVLFFSGWSGSSRAVGKPNGPLIGSALRDEQRAPPHQSVHHGQRQEARGQEHSRHARDVLDGAHHPAVCLHVADASARPPPRPFSLPRPDRSSEIWQPRRLTPRRPPLREHAGAHPEANP